VECIQDGTWSGHDQNYRKLNLKIAQRLFQEPPAKSKFLAVRHHGVTRFATANVKPFQNFGFTEVWNSLVP
jgi:hypothetical protein